ncbi:hypothetical protein R3P38DRAFT_2527651, partial [Favolaschia claudopus]
MAVAAASPPAVAPPFDWSKRRDYAWFSAEGAQKIRQKVAPFVSFALDTFQVECAARILDGQDVLCISATGTGKTALIYAPLMTREGTISLVISPTNFLQRDMVASMQKKGIAALAINSDTLIAASLASPT